VEAMCSVIADDSGGIFGKDSGSHAGAPLFLYGLAR
jgi:hypothetical protein